MAHRTRTVLFSVALATFALAGNAAASTVTYTSLKSVTVPDNTGVDGIPSTIKVDTGRPPVKSLEVGDLQPVWLTNGTDFSAWLNDPRGDQMYLMTVGCSSMPGATHFTITDSGPLFADGSGAHGSAFCSTELENGIGKPHDFNEGTLLGTFAGKPSAGLWTLHVRDAGLLSGGGTFNGWDLRITHDPLSVRASAERQKKPGKSARIRVKCNADCSLTTGGAAKTKVFELLQGQLRALHVKLTKRGRNRLEDRGVAKVTLDATTVYGDSHREVVKVKLSKK